MKRHDSARTGSKQEQRLLTHTWIRPDETIGALRCTEQMRAGARWQLLNCCARVKLRAAKGRPSDALQNLLHFCIQSMIASRTESTADTWVCKRYLQPARDLWQSRRRPAQLALTGCREPIHPQRLHTHARIPRQ